MYSWVKKAAWREESEVVFAIMTTIVGPGFVDLRSAAGERPCSPARDYARVDWSSLRKVVRVQVEAPLAS